MTGPTKEFRSRLATGLVAIQRASTVVDVGEALKHTLADLYGVSLGHHVRAGRLRDFTDLRAACARGVPVEAAKRVLDVLDDDLLASYLRRTLELLIWRLDPVPAGVEIPTMPDPLRDGEIHGATIARLLVFLESDVREFCARVLIAGPPTRPATIAERAAARQKRLGYFKGIIALQGFAALPDSEIYKMAGVGLCGRGSGPEWKSGKLPDSAKTSRAIEAILSFRTKCKPSRRYKRS